MGLADSLGVLSTLPAEGLSPFLEAALREPYPEIQAAAVEMLAGPDGLGRADLVVLHFADLLPPVRDLLASRPETFREAARRETLSDREGARKAGYEMLAALNPREAPAILLRGLHDPSPAVRESVSDRLEALAQKYYDHLVTARIYGDSESRRFVDEHRPAMHEVLGPLLRSYSNHSRRVFVDIAIESGEELYGMIADLLQSRADPAACAALVHGLASAVSEPALELVLRFHQDARPRVQEAAADVFRLRKDPGFPALMASVLAKLSPERLEALARRFRELPWWHAVEAAPDIDAFSAQKLLDFVALSGLDPRRRNATMLFFRRSPHPEVRSHMIAALQAVDFPDLLDVAAGMLNDPSDEVKMSAARTIIGVNPPDKARILMPLLNSPSEDIRRVAMREVAGASFDRYLKAFDRLDLATREAAAKALAKIDPRIVDRLGEEIAAPDPERRLRALKVVDYVDAETDLRPNLMALLSDEDCRVRATAIKVLRLTHSSEDLRLLVAALGDPDPRVRANAIEVYEDSGDPRSVQVLLPLLRDADNRVRANAAKALWNLGREEGKSTLLAMLRDERELMRLSAVWALGEVRMPGAADLLLRRAEVEPSGQVRAKISEAMAKLGVSPPGGPT